VKRENKIKSTINDLDNHKLDSYPKKQTMVSPKVYSASATTDTLAAASEKPSEK